MIIDLFLLAVGALQGLTATAMAAWRRGICAIDSLPGRGILAWSLDSTTRTN
jgi:hypothetical protein